MLAMLALAFLNGLATLLWSGLCFKVPLGTILTLVVAHPRRLDLGPLPKRAKRFANRFKMLGLVSVYIAD